MSYKLKPFIKFDREDREVRVNDQVQYFASLIVVGCIVGMCLWLNSLSEHITNVSHAQARQQRALYAEAQRVGLDRAQLVSGCQRLNRLLRSINTTSSGDYALFSLVVHLTKPTQRGYAQIRAAADGQSWTPTVDCAKMIDTSGSHYAVPKAIPFTVRRPPRSQITTTASRSSRRLQRATRHHHRHHRRKK